ncbi:MAG: mandelate racemase/muconate lactonizing enzyme family protein [Candidatus Poribacteria bacterium]|nr:mandelate racemase/muconate lactonizing enzyme family protein [Candidatus Poribacteria bacterium]
MKITSIELRPIYATREMGRTSPSDPEKAVSHHIIVRLHTDAGITGLGEMSDVNFSLTPETVNALHARLEPLLLGRSPFELTAIQVALGGQTWEHQVVGGIDIALHDAIGKALDVPLYQLFGGKYRERIPFAYPLAPCKTEADVEANLARIERLLAQGHSTIRYYFGANLTVDERFLTQLRERWGDDVEINALDASGRFDVETAIDVIRRFTPFNPNLVESPVKGRHHAPIEDFRAVRAAVALPISEHVADAAVAVQLARHEAVDIFNLGVGYAGMTACYKMFGLAEIFGIQTLLGSTVELSIGTAARAHLVAALPNVDFPCYPAGPLVYHERVVKAPVHYEAGHIIVPEGPGLGLELDEERLTAQRLW